MVTLVNTFALQGRHCRGRARGQEVSDLTTANYQHHSWSSLSLQAGGVDVGAGVDEWQTTPRLGFSYGVW